MLNHDDGTMEFYQQAEDEERFADWQREEHTAQYPGPQRRYEHLQPIPNRACSRCGEPAVASRLWFWLCAAHLSEFDARNATVDEFLAEDGTP